MRMYLIFKRAFDIVVSGVSILVLAPVWVPIAAALKLPGDHDVFYGQTRIGLGNRHFKIWKFATWVVLFTASGLVERRFPSLPKRPAFFKHRAQAGARLGQDADSSRRRHAHDFAVVRRLTLISLW